MKDIDPTHLVIIAEDAPEYAQEYISELFTLLESLQLKVLLVGLPSQKKSYGKLSVRSLKNYFVVSSKELVDSNGFSFELKLLSKKSGAWSRVRADFVMTLGSWGVLPDHFPGWDFQGNLYLQTAYSFFKQGLRFPSKVLFSHATNESFKFGSLLLSRPGTKVTILSDSAQNQGGELFWHVLRDRFLSSGGIFRSGERIKHAEKISPTDQKIYIQNDHGVRIENVNSVILVPHQTKVALLDPSRSRIYIRCPEKELSDPDYDFRIKLFLQELRLRIQKKYNHISYKIFRNQLDQLKQNRKTLDSKSLKTTELPYEGKLLKMDEFRSQYIRTSFQGEKSFEAKDEFISLECYQETTCRECINVCPEAAISKSKLFDLPKLNLDQCTHCMKCLPVCPASAIFHFQSSPRGYSMTAVDQSQVPQNAPMTVELLNRKGDPVGSGRTILKEPLENQEKRMMTVDCPSYLLWDARGIKFKTKHLESALLPSEEELMSDRISILFQGQKRLFSQKKTILQNLVELGEFPWLYSCRDESCRRCEVTVNGQRVLSCQNHVKDSDELSLKIPTQGFCEKKCSDKRSDSLFPDLVERLEEHGSGVCQGRLCLMSSEGQWSGYLRFLNRTLSPLDIFKLYT